MSTDDVRQGKSSALELLAAGFTATTIDLTGKTAFEWVEIRTDAGIVRVNVGLVTTRGDEPTRSAVVVEVERNYEDCGIKKTEAGGSAGNWSGTWTDDGEAFLDES